MNWDTSGFTLAGEAPDGEMALSLMQDIAPDLLITDVKMPFMDGLELARLTKQSMPWVKIIILSGHDEFEYARQAINAGVEEYLLKPVTSAQLFETLGRIAQKIEEENEKERLERDKLLGMADIGVSGLIDMISTASKIIEELGGDPRRILFGYTDAGTLREAVSSTEAARRITHSILERAIDFRDTVSTPAFSDSIREAREYIHAHYREQGLSLNAVAAAVNVSPNYFSTIFARETGENFINYVTRIRLEQAKNLLKTTKLRTADVAYEAGYSDSHYFSYVFKKNVGLSPREFRTCIS
jgi:two-component system response regulator YesN